MQLANYSWCPTGGCGQSNFSNVISGITNE